MKTGSHIRVLVVQQFDDQTETTEVWSGVVPHDSDYPRLDEDGSELGRNLLEAIARQKPWEVVGVLVVEDGPPPKRGSSDPEPA